MNDKNLMFIEKSIKKNNFDIKKFISRNDNILLCIQIEIHFNVTEETNVKLGTIKY